MGSEALSVVIRCGNDLNVLDCISSIDVDSEIIVSFTGTPEVAERIRETGAICVEVEGGNLSIASNVGFEKATSDYVVITDSDTVFEPGTLEQLRMALSKYSVARAKIRFLNPSNRIITGLIASARDYVNSLKLVYTPGIAVRKGLLKELEGVLFNDIVPFAVDADLDFRIKQAGIPVAFLENSFIQHSVVSLRHDLRAAYRIGKGCAKSIMFWNTNGNKGKIPATALKGVQPRFLPDLLRKKGFPVLFYQCIWDLFYWTGYIVQRYNH